MSHLSKVTELLSNPVEKFGRWWVTVRCEFQRHETTANACFASLEQALKIKKGDYVKT